MEASERQGVKNKMGRPGIEGWKEYGYGKLERDMRNRMEWRCTAACRLYKGR